MKDFCNLSDCLCLQTNFRSSSSRASLSRHFSRRSGNAQGLPLNKSVIYAYEHTTQGSGLRKLIADWYAWSFDSTYYENPYIQTLLRQQSDFAVDLIVSLANLNSGKASVSALKGNMPEKYQDKDHSPEK